MFKKLNPKIILLVILILGFCVRLYKINNPIADWHSWRQADTASVTKNFIKDGIDLFHPRYHDISSAQSGIFNPEGYRMVEFPFYNAISAFLTKTFPNFSLEVWSRLVIISSAVITSFFLYLIGKKYLGSWGGVLAASFYLFIPYNIYFTRVILPDPFGAMCAVIALWFYIVFIDTNSQISLYISGLSMAAALLIKPFYGFYLLPLIYLTLQKYNLKTIFQNKKILWKFIIFSALTLLPFLLWRTWESRFPEGIPFFTWMFNGDHIRFRPAFWRWVFDERVAKLILGTWGLILFAFGLLAPKTNFFKVTILSMFLYVTIIATANVRHDYYQILTMPAISLIVASGTLFLWNNTIFNRFISRTLVVFSIIMMLMIGWLGIKDDYQINHPELVEVGKVVDETLPKDALVIAPYNGDTAFLYQTNRRGWPVIDDSIDNIIKKGADYYVSIDLGSADTKNFEKRFKTIKKTDKYIILKLQ
ncbi:MAG TPA: glycosyltransferase family 39 protein [Alphaproteobacteria bacterium]|jgi:4-amino-4-deoxy-L-arabinose transferase-like glycosyltransferase|nr:glycosyltransferase family 39 protein [Alphaproteobacteria bacterium]